MAGSGTWEARAAGRQLRQAGRRLGAGRHPVRALLLRLHPRAGRRRSFWRPFLAMMLKSRHSATVAPLCSKVMVRITTRSADQKHLQLQGCVAFQLSARHAVAAAAANRAGRQHLIHKLHSVTVNI